MAAILLLARAARLERSAGASECPVERAQLLAEGKGLREQYGQPRDVVESTQARNLTTGARWGT